jgi:hypothetical protein
LQLAMLVHEAQAVLDAHSAGQPQPRQSTASDVVSMLRTRVAAVNPEHADRITAMLLSTGLDAVAEMLQNPALLRVQVTALAGRSIPEDR